MDANSANKQEENQSSPPLLKLKAIELENKLLIEKQRYILLQSELESSTSIASKHLELYKDECSILKEKMAVLENENKVLREKDLKNQETIQRLLKKTEKIDNEYRYESPKKYKYLNKDRNQAKEEVIAQDTIAIEKERKNTPEFVDLDSDSDSGMRHSPEVESDSSLIVMNGECSTPRKKLKSSSDSILCYDGVATKDNHHLSGNTHTLSPGNSSTESARMKYWGRIPTLEQKQHALVRAEQLQRNIRSPFCAKSITLSHVSGSCWFTLTRNFCMNNNFCDNDMEMTLQCEDGVEYAVRYLGRRNAFSGGWSCFAKARRLEIGDVLVFELIAPARLKVYIIKAIHEI